LDFEDCLSLAHMEQQHLTQVYSYDWDFDSIAGIDRLEPERQSVSAVEKEATRETDTA
jgi:hypothetical protein